MRKHIASELAIEHTKEIGNRKGLLDKASFKKLDFKKRLEAKVFVEYMGKKVKKKKRLNVLGVLNQVVSSTPQSTQLTKYQQFSALLCLSSKSLSGTSSRISI